MTITTIAKRFTFEAAHHLPTVPEHHKCHRMHGHSYGVEFQFTGNTNKNGFCDGIDYSDIAAVWARLHEKLDHRTLNDVEGLEIPTTENLVVWIAKEFVNACGYEHRALKASLSKVRVQEAPTTWCEFVVSQVWRRFAERK